MDLKISIKGIIIMNRKLTPNDKLSTKDAF